MSSPREIIEKELKADKLALATVVMDIAKLDVAKLNALKEVTQAAASKEGRERATTIKTAGTSANPILSTESALGMLERKSKARAAQKNLPEDVMSLVKEFAAEIAAARIAFQKKIIELNKPAPASSVPDHTLTQTKATTFSSQPLKPKANNAIDLPAQHISFEYLIDRLKEVLEYYRADLKLKAKDPEGDKSKLLNEVGRLYDGLMQNIQKKAGSKMLSGESVKELMEEFLKTFNKFVVDLDTRNKVENPGVLDTVSNNAKYILGKKVPGTGVSETSIEVRNHFMRHHRKEFEALLKAPILKDEKLLKKEINYSAKPKVELTRQQEEMIRQSRRLST